MSRRFCTCVGIEGPRRFAMMVSALFAVALGSFPGPAHAESDSHRQEGVTLRLVALAPDAQGRLRGALSIELEPGWKTYWITPGPVGLAPRLDFSGSTGLVDPAVGFPAPVRFAEGEAQSIGYVEPVALPITARAAAGAPTTLRVNAFLGVCRELCVPVQATLTAEPTSSLSDRALVRRAEDGLPVEAAAPSPVLRWSADGTDLVIDVSNARPVPTDVLVAAGDGWSFGKAVGDAAAGSGALALPVLARPSPEADLRSVDLLLTTAESAQLSRAVTIMPR